MHNKMFGNRLAEGIIISYKSLSAAVSALRGQLYSSQTDVPKKLKNILRNQKVAYVCNRIVALNLVTQMKRDVFRAIGFHTADNGTKVIVVLTSKTF